MRTRIIVVEDESLVALSIEEALTSMGYDVPLTTGLGEVAVRRVQELKPDLILMDIHLKGAMDGIEAAKRIWDSFRMPVIFLSAYADLPILEKLKATGPCEYIEKPFEEERLRIAVETMLGTKGIPAKP